MNANARTDVAGHASRLRTRPLSAAGRGFDARLLAMAGVLLAIWLTANFITGGIFLSPRNLFNLSLQVTVVAIMASGMVLVIVTREIDLSVGSQVGFLGVLGAMVQSQLLPAGGAGNWLITCLVMLAGGMTIGLFQGALVAYARIPSFVVTLGGLLFFRNAAYELNGGTTIAPLDARFQMLGGGENGVLGAPASWAVSVIFAALVLLRLYMKVRRRRSLGARVRLDIGEVLGAVALICCGFGFVWVMVNYRMPGTQAAAGIAVPVLILAVVTMAMGLVARQHRFGRHVFAVGGDPVSARMTGINTRRVVVKVFVLMGFLAGLASIVLTARLNAAASGAGTMMELYVIAAAVVGGTSLAGGSGTILGGLVGALIMQSLQNAMVLVGVPSPLQSMILAGVLIAGVWIDMMWRQRRPA